jgi:hypothetical protein
VFMELVRNRFYRVKRNCPPLEMGQIVAYWGGGVVVQDEKRFSWFCRFPFVDRANWTKFGNFDVPSRTDTLVVTQALTRMDGFPWEQFLESIVTPEGGDLKLPPHPPKSTAKPNLP